MKEVQIDTPTGSPNFLEPSWILDLKTDLRKNISRIFEQYKIDGQLEAFRREWVSETELWLVSGNSLYFTTRLDELELHFEIPLELATE